MVIFLAKCCLSNNLLLSAAQAEIGAEGLYPEVEVVLEKRSTPDEEQKAKPLQLPPTFSDVVSKAEKDKPEDFKTEVCKAQETSIIHCSKK